MFKAAFPDVLGKSIKADIKIRIGVCGVHSFIDNLNDDKKFVLGDVEFNYFKISTLAQKLENFDGVIFLSGAFEKIENRNGIRPDGYHTVEVDQASLNHRYKEVQKILKARKWVCFLTTNLSKKVLTSQYNEVSTIQMDLSKLLLKEYNVDWNPTKLPITKMQSCQNEFHNYIETYGVGFNVFSVSDRIDHKVLAKYNNDCVSF